MIPIGGLLLAACPSDPPIDADTDPSTSGVESDDTTGACSPGQTEPCTCPGGGAGTQTCEVDGSGFGACECEGVDTGTTDTGTTVDPPGDESTTTSPQPCTSNEECVDLARGDCEEGVCDEDGTCVVQPLPLGTACGSAQADECSGADTCDGEGSCSANDMEDGAACSDCATGPCTCTAGACGECSAFAPTNNFITAGSIEGWELTGDWGLYRRTPSSELHEGTVFIGQVLGTNGNRTTPYPGYEAEASYARTRPTPLPPTIAFLSWNVDEGGASGSDNKTVRVSVDGGATWEVLADCTVDASPAMCQPNTDQDAAVFSLVQLPVPVALQGQPGIVEFGYDAGDACCEFERGWYIDSLNVATECRCQAASDCADESTACGTAYCAPWGECALMGMPDDTACGDPFANDCNAADTCDGIGYCRDNEQPAGLTYCGDCPGGGPCSFCEAGLCQDCITFSDFGDFNDPGSVAQWTITQSVGTSSWGLYDAAPPNQNTGEVAFPNAPVFGTDGNRNTPYPGGEQESSSVVTGEGVVPVTLTFNSWHMDEGGSFYDDKTIELSVDGGVSWELLVSCSSQPDGQPFCMSVFDERLGTDWDPVSIDTSAWAGQTGRLRFSYDTMDSCCEFERGWFIDDLNAFSISCNDEPFS